MLTAAQLIGAALIVAGLLLAVPGVVRAIRANPHGRASTRRDLTVYDLPATPPTSKEHAA